jgi:hypothetical protein
LEGRETEQLYPGSWHDSLDINKITSKNKLDVYCVGFTEKAPVN